MSRKPSFRRLVLLSEDVYRSALQCMSKNALAKVTEQSSWFEKSNDNGRVEKIQVTEATRTEPSATTLSPTNNSNMSLEEDEAQETTSVPAIATATESNQVDMPSNTMQNTLTSNRKNIPMSYRTKYDQLLRKLMLTNRFHTDSLGQLVLDGNKILPNSNFHKLFSTLFANTSVNMSDVPIGFDEFVTALRKEGIKPYEVTSKVGKLALATKQSGSGKRTRSLSLPPGKRVRCLHVY